MADVRITIPPGELTKFERLLGAPVDLIERIAGSIKSMPPQASPAAAIAALTEQGFEHELVVSIISPLVSLASVSESKDATPEDVMEAVSSDLQRTAPKWWSEQNWQAREPILRGLISAGSPIHLLAKAMSIHAEGAGLTLSLRILTDTRWVFSDDADNIVGALTRHLLSIVHIDSSGNDETSTFVMDENDLRRLEEQAGRALKKGRTIRALTGTTSTPTFTP